MFKFCWLWIFSESNSTDIFALRETNLDNSVDSGNFSVRGYIPLIWKESSTHMYCLCEGRISLCMRLIFRKLCRLLLMFSIGFTSLSVYFFFLCWSPCSSLYMVLDSNSSNIDEVLSINPSGNVFVFQDFNVHHKNWPSYSGGTDRFGELCYNFKQPYSDD